MLSIIVLGNEAKESEIKATLSALSTVSDKNELILIATDKLNSFTAPITKLSFVSSKDKKVAESILQGIKQASSETILFIDARIPAKAEDMQHLISSLRTQNTISYVPLEIADETLEFADLNIDTITTTISYNSSWPVLMLLAQKSFLKTIENLEAQSVAEAIAKIIIKAVADREAVSRHSETLLLDSSLSANELCELSNSTRARLLSYAINSSNIEDLFPEHAWNKFEEEAAAACYHTLAAQFLRFGDTESARECLSFSDKLEDSPRSLALKALISVEKGETLGAVANMVSSLQQYEVRKRNKENKHYLTFSPDNIELINYCLQQGLEALNKKNNETALEHFATAVFNFDKFYSENKVDRILN